MDSGKQTRKFPGNTLSDLEAAVAKYEAGTHPCGAPAPGHLEALKAEIAARKDGTSVAFKTPQVSWGMI